MVAAFGTAPTAAEIAPLLHPVVEDLAHSATEAIDTSTDVFIREERIQRGDTVVALLARLGVDDNEALNYLRSEGKAAALSRQMSPNKTVTAQVTRDGTLLSLIFPLNGGKDQALIVERDPDHRLQAREQTLPLETHVLMKSGEIRYSLFGATDDAGIPDSIAMQMADIFGGDIDFHRDIRKGDRFSVIFESVTHLGKMVRTGRILAAEFVNGGRAHRAIWYEGGDDRNGYYTPKGDNIRKTFLRSPLEFSRVTSSFSAARVHPVLNKVRAHQGVDFGAPTGTHVKATGDGAVEFAGWRGGYGKLIVLRHQGYYETAYGHLNGFAAGLRKGTRVKQGDVIGYVGQTGLATGPHLHYEFRLNGMQRNPLAAVLPAAPPLPVNQLDRFYKETADVLARLDDIRRTNLALID
jgi:murein DD-endopeptidase MepM/ murein hydrolase activator NlpD